MATSRISSREIFGAEGAALLRMHACSELAQRALDEGNDGLFDEAQAQMQTLEAAYPEIHDNWMRGAMFIGSRACAVETVYEAL